MPTYEYECERTGKRFEKFQAMSEAPLTECPTCGGPVHRLISSGGGIIFKGSGFYATDYRRSSGNGRRRSCSRDNPCCGADTPCDKPSCET